MIMNNDKRASKRQIKASYRFNKGFGYICITVNYYGAMIPGTSGQDYV